MPLSHLRAWLTLALKPQPLNAQADLSFALQYVDNYYEGVRDVLSLRDKVHQQAIENYKEFSKLTDPPSVSAAVFGEIFSQVIGLIPGGKLVTAAVSAGVFAGELAKLQKEIDASVYEVSSADKQAKATERSNTKAEKIVGHAKTGIDAGKAVVGAGMKAAEERAVASAAEATAQENASMQDGRIGDWTKATALARSQEQALTDKLELALRKGADSGKLQELVRKRLGPIPAVSGELQQRLVKQYEKKLYWQRLRLVKETTHVSQGSSRVETTTETRLEFFGGAKPSQALLRRIADLLDSPMLAHFPVALGTALELGPPTPYESTKRLRGSSVSANRG